MRAAKTFSRKKVYAAYCCRGSRAWQSPWWQPLQSTQLDCTELRVSSLVLGWDTCMTGVQWRPPVSLGAIHALPAVASLWENAPFAGAPPDERRPRRVVMLASVPWRRFAFAWALPARARPLFIGVQLSG